jgi:hypothetical protein
MQHFPINAMKAITILLESTVQQFDSEQLKVNDAKIVIVSVGYRYYHGKILYDFQ